MSKRKPPLTDYQKTVYTPEEQEMLKLGAQIIRYDFSDNEIQMAKNLVQKLRRFMGQPPLTEEELDSIAEQAKNKS